MEKIQDKFITLQDGRTLAYTEHGDLSGQPVFMIHGNPSSRLMRHPDESIVENLGARIITPDRPGYGLSDFQPNRTLLDFPDDIAQLADALGIEKFAIFGVSAGGPYAAACAYKLADRITQAALVSGVSTLDRPNAYDDMSEAWQTAFKTGNWPEWLLRQVLKLRVRAERRDPEKAIDDMAALMSLADAKLMLRPEFHAGIRRRVYEATRNGTRGWAREIKVLVAPWGFDPAEITVPVHLWYWEDDPAVPQQMGRYFESKIPNTIPHFLPGGGHLFFLVHWGEIIEALIS